MTKVLVTGAGGFIGSHLAERLLADGAEVRALVHYNALGSAGWLDASSAREDLEVMSGDVMDSDFMRGALRGCERVYHLAALIGIPYSYQAPRSYVRTNVEGTLNVLQAARDLGIARVVHTSTSEVYGSALSVPIDETHPLQGQSPYSASKIGADKMAEAYHRSFATPVVTVRPFNTFGPRQSARAVIPTIISQGLAGEVVRLGNTNPTRDFTYVADTVDGFVKAGAAEGVEGRTINLGTGREISIGDLVGLVGAALGKELTIEGEADRARPTDSEVDRLLSDNGLAGELLGWTPATSLEQGIAQTVDWVRDNAARFRTGTYAV